MPRLSIEARRRIVSLYSCGYSVPVIVQRLEQEDVKVSKRAVYDLVKKFRLKGVVKDLPRQKKARILTGEIKRPATRVIASHVCNNHACNGHACNSRACNSHAWWYTRRVCSTPREIVVHTNTLREYLKISRGATRLHACKNEVIIERYRRRFCR